jgi:AraC-like DNA-binding protein
MSKTHDMTKSGELKTIMISNINTHRYSIIYTDNCEITFQSGNECFFAPRNSLLFVERGVQYSCVLKKVNPQHPPFKSVVLDEEILLSLKDILVTVYDYKLNENKIQRTIKDKILRVNAEKDHVQLFNNLLRLNHKRMVSLKIAYLISRLSISEEILHSVIISSAFTFTDKVRELVRRNLSRKWRLSMIADIFNIEEVTVRKRLEAEGVSFNNLLLALRMNQAMKMLLENEKQTHQIAAFLGFNTPSYFIRLFKEFYGITPKQYVIYFRS